MPIKADFKIKQGSTFRVTATLTGADGAPQNLTSATAVTMTLRPLGGGTAVYSSVACTIGTPATAGIVTYSSPAVLPTSTPPGLYHLDFFATLAGGIVVKFPSDGFKTVQVLAAE